METYVTFKYSGLEVSDRMESRVGVGISGA